MGAKYVQTCMGYVAWSESERGVRASTLPRVTAGEALAALGVSRGDPADPVTDATARRLVAYFSGERCDLSDVPLDLPRETEFQAAVREVVRAIPPGATLSYGEVAAAAGSPGAARAVGQVMATNPVPPFVPCHRVLAAGGRIGGYGGSRDEGPGLALKRRLLALEGYPCAHS